MTIARQHAVTETRLLATIPPRSHIIPPINAPVIRPSPAAAKNPANIVAREPGSNSVHRERKVTIVNSTVKKMKNRPVRASEKECAHQDLVCKRIEKGPEF